MNVVVCATKIHTLTTFTQFVDPATSILALEAHVISLFASYHALVWPKNAAKLRFWCISVGRTAKMGKKLNFLKNYR